MDELYLIAKTEKQLSVGMKFLYTQKIRCYAEPFEIKVGKMAFKIYVDATEECFEELRKQYLLITS